jgi:TPR repeat protein
MIKLIRTAAFLLCTAVATPVMAQDFDKGLAAARAGDYATALQEWRTLADQGNAQAQYALGLMYENGTGMIQDYAEAVNWYRLAAEQGHATSQKKSASCTAAAKVCFRTLFSHTCGTTSVVQTGKNVAHMTVV